MQLPCSPLPPIRACCRKSFFPFFFFPFFLFHPNLSAASRPPCLALTQAIPHRRRHQPRRRQLDTATTAPTQSPRSVISLPFFLHLSRCRTPHPYTPASSP